MEWYNVTWDVSDPPQNITNGKSLIFLRKGEFTSPVILQNRFNILLGRFEITVPWVVDGSDYSIVLMVDSGNFSPQLTITGSGVAF